MPSKFPTVMASGNCWTRFIHCAWCRPVENESCAHHTDTEEGWFGSGWS